MGLFSWKYCDDPNHRMICGKVKDSYLLIPEEFGGGHITERRYDGYGCMGGHDVYELLAIWNKKYISSENICIPKRESFSEGEDGQRYFESALKRYEYQCKCITDFINEKPDDFMKDTYGKDYLREIGIYIDFGKKSLKYPLKIAEKSTSVYEKCKASVRDPLQGCY